ncbi:MAG: acyl-CoA thioesterase [Acidimicrobiales bacterium]
MESPEGEFDVTEAVSETLHFLVVRAQNGELIGQPPEWSGDYLFGGFVIAQALIAATYEVPSEVRVHSMHAYFLRPATSQAPIVYRVTNLRSGHSFTARHLQALQEDKPVLDMIYSLTADTEGYCYDLAAPEEIPSPSDMTIRKGPGPWVTGDLGPSAPAEDGTRQSTHRMWFRIPAELPDDVHLHTALLGFATDWTGTGGRPLHLEGDVQGMVSLDHAAWFHRPARVDSWHFYDVQSLTNAGGRGLLRGVIRDLDGQVVASVAQEMRLTPVT